MTPMQEALRHLGGRQSEAQGRLAELLRIKSVSNEAGHEEELIAAADFVRQRMIDIGLDRVSVFSLDPSKPRLVLGEDDSAGPDAPLVVFYAHYDVQPEGRGWNGPAFEPQIRDGRIFARGAGDDKGPVTAILEALEACIRGGGKLPVRVRVIIEGEEENGSGEILKWLATPEAAATLDGASAVVVCDTLATADGSPTITFGLRGLLYCRLTVTGAGKECHSGQFGGVVQDPLEALTHLIANLRDPETGELLIPNVMERIQAPSQAALELLRRSQATPEAILREIGGAPGLIRIEELTLSDQLGWRPSLTVHRLTGGHQDPDATPTNIPIEASGSFSIRLVPGLEPEFVERQLRDYLTCIVDGCFKGRVTINLEVLKRSHPVRFEPTDPVFQAASTALETAWGKPPAFVLAGGSIPVVSPLITAVKGAPVILWGGTNSDSSFHGPDENLSLSFFHNSAVGLVKLLYGIAESKR